MNEPLIFVHAQSLPFEGLGSSVSRAQLQVSNFDLGY